MILKQEEFQKPVQIMKLKENQGKKVPLCVIKPVCITKISVCMERNSPTPKPFGHIVFDIPKCYNLYSTREPEKLVASKQRREIL